MASYCMQYLLPQMLAFDREGRAVITEHICEEGETGDCGDGEDVIVGRGRRKVQSSNLVVINVYVPMVDRENVNADRLNYKMLFYSLLQDRCTALEQAGK